jgi:hypothetical protein
MDTGMEPPVTEEPEDYTAILAPIPPEDILLFLKDQGLIAPDVELLPLDEKMAMEEGDGMSPPPFEAMMSEGETESQTSQPPKTHRHSTTLPLSWMWIPADLSLICGLQR